MSAQHVYDLAPIGSIIRYSDGTPRPPERHRKKLAAWERLNGSGRLTSKQSTRQVGNTLLAATITLFEGRYGSGEVEVLRVYRQHSVDSDLDFDVQEFPKIGSIRVMDRAGDGAELLFLAPNRDAAERWLQINRYSNAVLEEVTDEGRAES